MDLGFDGIVTISGMLLVFMILVLLMFIIKIEGKFFDSREKRRQEKAQAAAAPVNAPNTAKASVQPAAAPAPAVEAGIPGAVVAAIAAAIAALSGGRYKLHAVRRASGDGRGSWGRAGVSDVTSPF
jgi:predicted lipid-binding transport protein (Tim44 family)